MPSVTDRVANPDAVEFRLNGTLVRAESGETILQAALRNGVPIPHLCYKPGYRADGNCRACMVDIDGERVLAPACCRQPVEGMQVTSNSERAERSQRLVVELLLSDMPDKRYTHDSELDQWATTLRLDKPRFEARDGVAADISHPAMAVNLDACIQCTRCVRACREEQMNDVIGYAFSSDRSKIVFDFDDPMGDSSCVACGECVQACPTGALMPAREAALEEDDRKVDSVCPYCGVGCQITYHVKDNRIQWVEGRDGPANKGRLCVKGRYGFDYVHHKHRLTTPLIRKPGVPKSADAATDPEKFHQVFRKASWEEALDLAASKLREIRDSSGNRALAETTAGDTHVLALNPDARPEPGAMEAMVAAFHRYRPIDSSVWQGSDRPSAATKKPICSRNSCVPGLDPIMSTIAHGCVTHRRSRHCSRASVQVQYRIRLATYSKPR